MLPECFPPENIVRTYTKKEAILSKEREKAIEKRGEGKTKGKI